MCKKLAFLISVVVLFSLSSTTRAQSGQPFDTIPALQEWTDGSGSYTFDSSSRIMINGSGLANEGSVFATDLLNLSGYSITVVTGSSPAAGDIYLTLGSTDPDIGDEGYVLTITDRVTIEAKTNAGAFYGTRTVLQALKQSYDIPAGTARDWPMYPLRGMHVDNGRKYFTVGWLRDHIREIAYLKMNIFHLHLSDREGFRIELFNHPEVPTAPYLTQAEMADLIDFAAEYHITILPEIDMPGHLTAALRNHPELWANGTSEGNLDLGIDASYVFVQEILDELIPLFPGPYWHMGADEYGGGYHPHYATYAQEHFCTSGTASPQDAFIGFVNFVNDIAKSYGKTSMCWHEPALMDYRGENTCTSLDTDIVINVWNGEAGYIIDRGNLVFNSNRWMTYYVLGGASSPANKIY
ncbi:MAG: beta-N-acetylhexosaminidase, partial [Planctomycetota bacterium]